jgi:circadian clock protein KaiB
LQKTVLKLFITGQTPRSERALANLRQICDDALGSSYELVVIDVLEQPHLAEEDRVIVTPTLIKQVPPPPRRVLGDLSDRERVLSGLGVPLPPSPAPLEGHASEGHA